MGKVHRSPLVPLARHDDGEACRVQLVLEDPQQRCRLIGQALERFRFRYPSVGHCPCLFRVQFPPQRPAVLVPGREHPRRRHALFSRPAISLFPLAFPYLLPIGHGNSCSERGAVTGGNRRPRLAPQLLTGCA